MDVRLIRRLASRDPENSENWAARSARTFRQVYLNPAVGWEISGSFARARVPFPETVIGRDHWLFKAYVMQLNPTVCYDHSVAEAHHLSQQPGSATVNAMLIAGLGDPVDAHLDIVAEKFGTSRRTVEAYEVLFFNVLDRAKDGAYISQIVYPDGRAVEVEEDYFETTPIRDLILRAAYNYRDFNLVARLVGMECAACVEELSTLRDREAETELEARLMGNALLMAQLGALNQTHVGLERATKLLAANRSPRDKIQTIDDKKDHDLATELATALASIPALAEADHQAAQMASQPGHSYPVDDPDKINGVDPSDAASNSSQSVKCCSSDPVTMFSEPVPAIWRNKDFDKPVVLVAKMSEPGLPDHYLTAENTGIPASEVVFEKTSRPQRSGFTEG